MSADNAGAKAASQDRILEEKRAIFKELESRHQQAELGGGESESRFNTIKVN